MLRGPESHNTLNQLGLIAWLRQTFEFVYVGLKILGTPPNLHGLLFWGFP